MACGQHGAPTLRRPTKESRREERCATRRAQGAEVSPARTFLLALQLGPIGALTVGELELGGLLPGDLGFGFDHDLPGARRVVQDEGARELAAHLEPERLPPVALWVGPP